MPRQFRATFPRPATQPTEIARLLLDNAQRYHDAACTPEAHEIYMTEQQRVWALANHLTGQQVVDAVREISGMGPRPWVRPVRKTARV